MNEDCSQILADLKVELTRVGETLKGVRVKQWCHRAGYSGIDSVDKKGLESLLVAVKKEVSHRNRKVDNTSSIKENIL